MGLKYSEEDILRVSKVVRTNVQNCQADFRKFGWDLARIAAFSQKITEAEALIDQEGNTQALMGKTIEKNEALTKCENWMVDLGERVKDAYKKDSAKYAEYPWDQIRDAHGSEEKIMPAMENAVRFGSVNQLELLPSGHTEEVQAEGESLLDEIRDKDEVQENKKESNQKDTQTRYVKFDDLVKTVTRLNSIGRKLYRKDPERLVLFNSPWPKRQKKTPEEPPVVPPAP